jgi:hypothetical protein
MIRLRCAWAVALLALGPNSGDSQDHETYDIGSYEPPDYTYRECIVVPEIATHSSDSSVTSTDNLATVKGASAFSSLRYAILPRHRFHLYTKKLEMGSENIVSVGYDAFPLSRTVADNIAAETRDYSRENDLTMSIETRDSARLYFPSGAFVGALAAAGYSMENRNTFFGSAIRLKLDTSATISYGRSSFTMDAGGPSLSLFAGAGWGRIRDVTFGAVALNMLDRIYEVLPKSQGIPSGRVQDFAAFIEKRRRLRQFDDRLSLIGNIDTLSQYLVDTRAIPGPSGAVTMELADQWQYAFSQNRLAGLTFSVYPGLIVNYARTFSSDIAYAWRDTVNYDVQLADADRGNARKGQLLSEDSHLLHEYQTELTYCINSAIQAAKPLSRFFQIMGRIDMNFQWYHYFARSIPSDIPETDYQYLIPMLEVHAAGLVAYYPDTRTTFTFGPNVSYNRSYNYLINETKNQATQMVILKNGLHFDFRSTEFELPVSFVYYVSPRMQYRLGASTFFRSYYSSEQSVIKGWYSTYSVSAGLTYQLF